MNQILELSNKGFKVTIAKNKNKQKKLQQAIANSLEINENIENLRKENEL